MSAQIINLTEERNKRKVSDVMADPAMRCTIGPLVDQFVNNETLAEILMEIEERQNEPND